MSVANVSTAPEELQKKAINYDPVCIYFDLPNARGAPPPHLYILNVLGSNRLSTKSSAPFAVCSIGSRLQPFNIVRDSSVFVYFFIFSGVRFGLT